MVAYGHSVITHPVIILVEAQGDGNLNVRLSRCCLERWVDDTVITYSAAISASKNDLNALPASPFSFMR